MSNTIRKATPGWGPGNPRYDAWNARRDQPTLSVKHQLADRSPTKRGRHVPSRAPSVYRHAYRGNRWNREELRGRIALRDEAEALASIEEGGADAARELSDA